MLYVKKRLLLASLVLLSSLSLAQKNEYSFKETYKVSNSPSLYISSNDGDIEVYPSDKNEIEVYYIVERGNELMKIDRERLEEDVSIDVISKSDYIEIEVKQKYAFGLVDWRDRINVSFEIYVPVKTSCDLHCSDGNILVRGLQANQVFRSSDGDIELAKIRGKVDAKTSDGDLEAYDMIGNIDLVTSDGDINLRKISGDIYCRSSDGDIEIEDVNGDIRLITSDGDLESSDVVGDMEVTTSDGDIRIDRATGSIVLSTSDGNIVFRDVSGSLKAKTSDGEIKGDIIRLDGTLELKTSDGNITVNIPDGQGYDLQIRAEMISTDIGKFSGESKDHYMDGKVDGGGQDIYLQASDGSVRLSQN